MGYIHINNEGIKDRCRALVRGCPYGGPHGQSVTRKRKDKNGNLKPKPGVSRTLPVMTLGSGKHYKKIAELVAKTGQRFAGGNPVEYLRKRKEAAIKYVEKIEKDILHPDWDNLSKTEKFKVAIEYGNKLIEQEGLDKDGWRTVLDNGYRRYGVTKYGYRTIGLSKIHTVLGQQATIIDTIRHEVAHAVAGPHADHGWKWQQEAVRLGASPNSGSSASAAYAEKMYKFVVTCEKCGATFKDHKDHSKRYVHGGGCRGKLIYTKNPEYPL